MLICGYKMPGKVISLYVEVIYMKICNPFSHHLSLRGHLNSFLIQEFKFELIKDRFKGATHLEGFSYNSESIIILG